MRIPSGRVLLFLLFVCLLSAPGTARAQDEAGAVPPDKAAQAQPAFSTPKPTETHRFWDRTNLELFSGVAAVRARHRVPTWLHPLDRPLYDALPQQAAWMGLRLPAPPAPTGLGAVAH